MGCQGERGRRYVETCLEGRLSRVSSLARINEALGINNPPGGGKEGIYIKNHLQGSPQGLRTQCMKSSEAVDDLLGRRSR